MRVREREGKKQRDYEECLNHNLPSLKKLTIPLTSRYPLVVV